MVEWNPPYITQDNLPSFYYREAGSSSNIWYKITNVEVDSANNSVSFKPQDTTGAYEYLVAYNKAYDYIDVPVSFLNDQDVGLSAKENRAGYVYADEASKEKANKGYLLAVKLSAGTGTGYSETVSWGAWDYSKRKIGPDSAQLFIKNYNISGEWKEFAELNKYLQYSNNLALNNTTITKIDNVSVSLEPTTKMDKDNNLVVTPGYMQVLRDAKHYYKLELKRGEKVGVIGLNDEGKEMVYAYRNINEYEFAKIVMLVMNDGLDRIGSLNFENKSQSDGSSGGSVSFNHIATIQIGKTYDYIFENFSPEIEMPFGDNKGMLSISCSGKCERNKATAGGYPKSFSQVTITATKKYTDMPASYSGQLTFSLSSPTSASITSKGQNIPINNVRVYVPFVLHDDENSYINNSTYGWWPE